VHRFESLQGALVWPHDSLTWGPSFHCTAYSGVVDISLVLIAWKLLLSLHMDRVAKIGAAIAMSMGVLYVVDFDPGLCMSHVLTQLFYSAGVASFVKTYQLWSMLSPDICESALGELRSDTLELTQTTLLR